jgi:hypothetical protein
VAATCCAMLILEMLTIMDKRAIRNHVVRSER